MASSDQLWFEMGVRDNVTKVLNGIRNQIDAIQLNMEAIGELKPLYENALKIEDAYDKIANAIRKIEASRGKTKDQGQLDQLDKMKSKLTEIRDRFENMASSELALGTKGQAAFAAIQTGLSLAISQVDRYTGNIDAASKAEERRTQDELRRTDALKAKYNELERYRNQWNDVMNNLAPGTTLNGATRRMGQSLDYRFNQVAAALQGGGAMPKSATGADYEKFIRDLKERMRELTAETDKYNNTLERNASLYRSVNMALSTAVNQRDIANIRGQRAEYEALEQKVRDLNNLSSAIAAEKRGLQAGTVQTPYYTQARVMEEMQDIQERYNYTLAKSKEQERQNTEAKRAAAQAARELTQAQQGLVSAYDKVTQAGQRSNGVLQQLQSQMGTYFSLLGAERLVRNVIQIGGEFEVQHIALQSILGDIQQANSMFEQMKELAVVSPFNFRQLAQYSKQVAAFGVPYEEMYDTTKRLADMSAGLGVDMSRLILAYGQVRSAAVLRGQELRQFTEAGIPMVQALANEFTNLNGKAVSTAEVFELISKRAVPFEMVKKVLWDMTNEGGRFYDMQYTLANTLAGKWSNLQDAWEIMLSDIAKGESLSGKFLKTMVSGFTTLIESVNTLTPLIAGVVSGYGMVKSAKWLSGFGNLGFNRIDQNVAAAQRLRAVELARQKINGEITRAQYTQLMQQNANKGNYYKVLAMEGRLNTLQIQRAFKQGDINRKELAYLVQLRIITEEERKQILLGNLGVGIFDRLKLSAKSFFTTLNASLGPIGWIAIGLDAILTIAMSIGGKASEINQKNKDLAEGFANRAKELADSVKSIQGSTPTSDEDYQRGIDGLKEMLKQHSSNYDAIMREASGLKTLQQQYEFLKKELNDSQKVYAKAEEVSEDFADASRQQFEKAKNVAREYFQQLKNYPELATVDPEKSGFLSGFMKSTEKIAERIKEILPNVGKDDFSNNVFRQLRDSMLQELGVGGRESMMIKIRLNELLQITDYNEAAELVQQNFENMLNKVAPDIANKIRYGRTLEEAERNKVQSLMNDAIKQTGDKYPTFAKYLQGLLNDSNFTADIQLRIAGGLQVSDLQRTIFENLPQNVSTDSQKRISGWLQNAGNDIYAARNKAKQDIDAAKNTVTAYDNAIAKGKKELQPLRDKARTDYLGMVSDAFLGLGYDYEGELKKSNKPTKTGGNKTDEQLKDAKARLDEIKDIYAEYKKYRDRYGRDKGLGMVAQIFEMDEDNVRDIVDNYEEKIRAIVKTIAKNQNSSERKKFVVGGWKLLGDIKVDRDKEEIDKALKELERYIQDETSKWNLYNGLLGKTGSKEFAMQAFVDGVQWDDMTRSMAEKLREMMSSDKIAAHGGDLFEMDEEQAEKFFGEGTKELKLWQEIVKDIRKNWTDSLNEVASATEKLLTIEEKIAKTEQELAELRQKYGANDPRALAKEQELVKQQADAFEQSEDYLRFYSAILSMTIDEAEKMGLAIKKNLVDQLAKGGINADKYLKSIKNIDQQLEKARSHTGQGRFFIEGGLEGQAQRKYNAAYDDFSAKALAVQEAEKALLAARKNGDEYLIEVAERRLEIARMELETAEKRAILSEKELKALQNFSKDLGTAIEIIHGMQEAVNAWQDLAKAVDGEEMEVSAWFEDTLGALDGIGQGLQNVVQSAMSGNISGMIGGAVSLLANPVKVLSQNHDKRRQKEIENSERRVKALTTAYQNLEKAMESALGGIYATGGYDEMFENLQRQRDELQKQMDLEYDKKATDKDKIADYEQQLMEAEEKLKNYALDMAKALYDIDLHSWASQLTEAVVSAWENGEDAVEAYRNKVKDIMKDLSTNILAKKVMERAFESLGIDNLIAEMMDSSSGKLNENAIPRLAEALGQAGNLTVEAITKTLDQLEAQGSIERGGSSSSASSMTNSIKGVTEETADLLASYINAIRADVSVNRMTLTEILYAVQGQSEMPMIARAQLQQLEQVAANTQRNADAAEMIYEILNQNVLGALAFWVK